MMTNTICEEFLFHQSTDSKFQLNTYPTSSRRHSYNRKPGVGVGVILLCTTEFHTIVPAPHRIDDIIEHSAAQVLASCGHGCHGCPSVQLGVKPLH